MKRTFGHVLTIIGAALIVTAVLLPTFLVPRLWVIPPDTVSDAATEVRDGTLLDPGQLDKNEPIPSRKNDPCYKVEMDEEERDLPVHYLISDKIPIQLKCHVEIKELVDDKIVTLQVGTTLLCDDREKLKNLINATLGRITVDHSTAYSIDDPISSVAINAPRGSSSIRSPTFICPGIQYQLPFGAERKSYSYFDVQVMRNFKVDFVGEGTQDGVKVHKYSMTIPPQNLYESLVEHFTRDDRKLTEADKSSSASMRLSSPAHKWGPEGDDDVELDRHYTNVRTVRVESTSGMIVNGIEEMFMYCTKDDKEAEGIASKAGREKEAKEQNRTTMKHTVQWDEGLKGRQMDRAKEACKSLTTSSTVAPRVLGTLGLALIVVDFRARSKSA